MLFALAGNQNSGKTTLFNQLTGSNQHVGNFPGVTVEQKSGRVKGHAGMTVVDLPGFYSMRPFSGDELVARSFLLQGAPDGIVNIIDATNLERSLYLTLQLMDLGLPMVLALNMMDEVRGNGGRVDAAGLEQALGLPVVPVSAAKGEGLEELLERMECAGRERKGAKPIGGGQAALESCLRKVGEIIAPKAAIAGIPPAFAAVKAVEDDRPVLEALALDNRERTAVGEAVTKMEQSLGIDRKEAVAQRRYAAAEELCGAFVRQGGENREHRRSLCLDNLLTHRLLGIPIFLAVMLSVFWLTFGVIGNRLSDLLALGVARLAETAGSGMEALGVNPVVHSLVIDGIFAGVGSVLSFLPIILTLFFFLSVLEDSGYMARVAFVMDRLLQGLGLSGRSFVPMLIGFGCSVPAILATRTLPGERERRMTVLLIPFMSCSAKLPIYAVFTAALFTRHQALVMTGLYLTGIAVGVLCGLVLKKTAFPGEEAPFIMELPSYRFPSGKSVLLLMWDRAKDFLTRAFTVIFLASLVIWFLQTFNYQFNVVQDSSYSLLATLGRFIGPVFAPLGFNDWRAATALLTGFTAKEAVVSTLAVLTGAPAGELGSALGQIFTPLSAASFLVFTLLYTPCVAAVAAVSRELKSARMALAVVALQCGVAWVAAMLVYQIGRLLGL